MCRDTRPFLHNEHSHNPPAVFFNHFSDGNTKTIAAGRVRRKHGDLRILHNGVVGEDMRDPDTQSAYNTVRFARSAYIVHGCCIRRAHLRSRCGVSDNLRGLFTMSTYPWNALEDVRYENTFAEIFRNSQTGVERRPCDRNTGGMMIRKSETWKVRFERKRNC